MAVVNLVNKTIEAYTSKVLKDNPYFLLGEHKEKMFRPLLEDGINDNLKELMDYSRLNESFVSYVELYFIEDHCQKFSSIIIARDDIGWDIVVTLPERKEQVRKALQKSNYKIVD